MVTSVNRDVAAKITRTNFLVFQLSASLLRGQKRETPATAAPSPSLLKGRFLLSFRQGPELPDTTPFNW